MTPAIQALQLTDLHLSGPSPAVGAPAAELGGPYQSFAQVLDLARRHPHWPPDLIFLTGDLTDDEEPALCEQAYAYLIDILRGCGQLCAVPGNHDPAALFQRCFAAAGAKLPGHFSLDNWQFILLDSTQPSAESGALAATQLSLLDTALAQEQAANAMILLHHPPAPVGSAWLDAIGLANAEAFWSILARHSGVRAILCGHVHQAYDAFCGPGGWRMLGTPATSVRQFKPRSQKFATDPQAKPGFRWFSFRQDGSIDTQIYRIP